VPITPDLSPYGTPGGTPQLNAAGGVLQNPANASIALTASGIPLADATGSLGQWGLSRIVSTANVIDDSQASPPTIAGTVSVTNGVATVTGTSTSFTTVLSPGMFVQIGNQTGVYYQVSAVASTTSLTLTATFSGTTNASTTLTAPRCGDAYIVGTTPTGAWSGFSKGDLVINTGTQYGPTLPGTASVTNGNATVTGTNTRFTDLTPGSTVFFFTTQTLGANGVESQPGYYTTLLGSGIISSIASNTSLTLTATFSGTTGATALMVTAVGWYRLVAGLNNAPLTGLTCIVTACQGTANGSFAGKNGNIAYYNGSAWQFVVPVGGQQVTFGMNDINSGAEGLYRAEYAGVQPGQWQITGGTATQSTATGTITTTSTTAVAMTSMSFAPVMAGFYEVYFTVGGTFNSGAPSATTLGEFEVTYGGTVYGGQAAASAPTNDFCNMVSISRGFVNGLQQIIGNWFVGAASTQTAEGFWSMYIKRLW
jgi:hypothetical protein